VSALAGVCAYGVRQGAYLAEGLEEPPIKAAAVGAEGGAAAVGLKFVHLAQGADEVIGGFHAVSSSP
jgi:hypothetical protein